jgi:hypothetical protein
LPGIVQRLAALDTLTEMLFDCTPADLPICRVITLFCQCSIQIRVQRTFI